MRHCSGTAQEGIEEADEDALLQHLVNLKHGKNIRAITIAGDDLQSRPVSISAV